MRLLISTLAEMAMTPDGVFWSGHLSGYDFWERYLGVFDEVHLLARTRYVAKPPARGVRASGPGVIPAPAPHFSGVLQAVRRYVAVRRVARAALEQADAVLLLIPQPFSQIVWDALEPGRPFAVQVTTDPYHGLAPGMVRHPLRPLLRWLLTRRVRLQCARACAVAYVTDYTLQRKYPPGPGGFAVGYSNVRLDEHALVTEPRSHRSHAGPPRIVFVGYLNKLCKGADVLIDAVAQCRRDGLELEVEFIGGGRYQPEFEARAAANGLGASVRFMGTLHSPAAVRERLDEADLFVLPSQSEGLPRAMIEAMARGLPCVGSSADGIPELLPDEDLVPLADSAALARKLREVLTDPERMARMSVRNLDRARDYRIEVIDERRNQFLRHLKERSEQWLRASGRM